jgi:hypothetical protein
MFMFAERKLGSKSSKSLGGCYESWSFGWNFASGRSDLVEDVLKFIAD